MITVTVLVYRAESFYAAHIHGWQAHLSADLTKKYWALGYSSEMSPDYEFASDAVLDRFWSQLDADRLGERFQFEIDPADTTTRFLASAYDRATSTPSPWDVRGPGHLYGGFHLTSGHSLEENQSLMAYDVEADDLFGLIIEYEPLASYDMEPVPDSETVFAAIRSVDESPPAQPDRVLRDMVAAADRPHTPPARPLLGALLYTDEDTSVATYVRKHFASLSEASGPSLRLYVIEQPEENWREASRYWKRVVTERHRREWTILGWLRTKPYDPSQAYVVARRLGVFPDELPCLVLFDRLDRIDKLVFPLLAASAQYFRSLFSKLQRLVEAEPTRELAFMGVRREYREILDTLKDLTASDSESDTRYTYNFEGQTVFINRPQGSVQLTDFQNPRASKEKRE